MRYSELLAHAGVEHGHIGPREAERLWERHLIPSAVPTVLMSRGSRVCDVGSGGGLPGLAIALARPDLLVTLLEPMERRCRFLEEAVSVAGLIDQVTVRRARAEELAPEAPAFDVVVARAVARLPRLLDLLLPLCRPGGQILAFKGSGVPAEIADAAAVLAGPRVARWDLLDLPVPGAAEGPRVRLVRVVVAATVTPTGRRPGRRPRATAAAEAPRRDSRREAGQR